MRMLTPTLKKVLILLHRHDTGCGGGPGFAMLGGNIFVYNTDAFSFYPGDSVDGVDFILIDTVRDFTFEFTDEFA